MRLIIDTDTAGDDCFSMLLAAAQPGVTLEAVTICNGNIDFDQQALAARSRSMSVVRDRCCASRSTPPMSSEWTA
jgi:inosine-uridine nucleoside N-ribohydrolase